MPSPFNNEDFYGEDIKRIKGVEEFRAGAETVEGVKVIDEHTVEITLVEYYSKALSFMGEMGIMPEHVWNGIAFPDLEKQSTDMIQYPVSSGPYKVINFVADEYVEMVANPDFFLGKPLTENLYLKVVNSDPVTAELTSGSVDIAAVTNLTSDEIAEPDAGNLDIATFYYDLFQVMRFSPQRPMEANLRKAMAYAIDRQSMVDTLMEGRGVISNMIISAGSWGYPSNVQGREPDLEKAKQFLADGGYVDVDGDGYAEDPEGNPMVLEMVYPSGLVVREQSAVVIQENLKQIGVNVELNIMDFPTLMGYFSSGEYDLMLMGHGLDSVDPDPSFFMNLGFNDEGKALCAQAATSPDKQERIDLYLHINCSVMSPNDNRLEFMEKMIDEFHVDGVIEIILQSCHTYNVESNFVKRMVTEKKGLAYMAAETDFSQSDKGQINTRLAAFLETIDK